jgi:hypothetical protein
MFPHKQQSKDDIVHHKNPNKLMLGNGDDRQSIFGQQ